MPRGSLNPNKATPPVTVASEAGNLVTGTPEQEAIWDELLNGSRHVIVEAVAGSGKTFTITQYAMRDKTRRIGLVAFNKHIATELTERMGGQTNVECMTYHSLGYKTVRQSVRFSVRVEQYKVMDMLDRISLPVSEKQEKQAKYRIAALVSLAKTYGVKERAELERIADLHDLDMNGMSEMVLDYTPKILQKCRDEVRTVDFDDMVWLPMELGLKVPQYDVLCVDEYQDTGLTQQWIAVRGGKRVVAVGDKFQAIYGFRGADSKSFDRLREQLPNVVTFPLTLTRRCPKSHVRLAQQLVPQIQALDDAPEGKVRQIDEEGALGEMHPGDLVVCRVNAPLLGTAYKLIRRGVKAVVRGRDIGQGIVKLVEKAERRVGSDIVEVMKEAGQIVQMDVAKFQAMPNGKGEQRAAAAQDKYDCLVELAQEAQTVTELKRTIASLFADFEEDGTPKNAVVLGTVHRTKGLEGSRVYVLKPELIPHPMAKRESDQKQEINLAYVAITRAKFDKKAGLVGELVFVGGLCPLLELESGENTPDLPPSRSKVTKSKAKTGQKAGERGGVSGGLLEEDRLEGLERQADWQVEEELDRGGVPEWTVDEDGIITHNLE